MIRNLFLTLSLSACSGATPPLLPLDPTSSSDTLEAMELSRVDTRGTAQSIAILANHLDTLPPPQLEEASRSLRLLSVNCPYTRAALQIPLVLHKAASEIEPESLDRLIQSDWQYLQQGLATHVAVLDRLGVDLPTPTEGDGLYPPMVMPNRTDLMASADPLARTQAWVSEITAIARTIDPATRALIETHSTQVEASTDIVRMCPRGPWAVFPGHPWTLGMQLNGWHDTLRRVEPFVVDANARSRVEAMIALMDSYSDAGFASIHDPLFE